MSTLPSPDKLAAEAGEILTRLVAFDTTSRNSNLDLIAFVEARLAKLGVNGTRVSNADGNKCNLYATVGPMTEGGLVLSGHTDVVPVDGQQWHSDPFVLTRRGTRLYGRGTADMKTFLALALAAAPMFRGGARPVHFAFSYDEEVGCIGAPAMIRELVDQLPPVTAVVVGEPTNMEVVSAHKAISTWVVTVTGHEAHSSLTHLGLSANMAAVRLMNSLTRLAERLERQASEGGAPFMPPHATLTIGQVNGGTAVNILARQCVFAFDLRCPPGLEPDTVIAPFLREAAAMDRAMRRRFPDSGVSVARRSGAPALAPEPNGEAEQLARRLAGDNGPSRAVSYAAEAGQFQQAGFSTIICGPGSIEQAHQPDEFIEIAQVERGAAFMVRLAEALQTRA